MFTRLCNICADTSQVARQPKKGALGEYYAQAFDIVLLCGLTELQAQLRWFDNVRTVKGFSMQSCFADIRTGGREEGTG